MPRLQRTVLLLALSVLALSIPTSASPFDDLDHDNMPDSVEGQLCGVPALREALTPPLPYYCQSSTDMGFRTSHLTAPVEEQATPAWALVDADGDYVPDAIEPTLCQVEDPGSAQDGACTGDDYQLIADCTGDDPASDKEQTLCQDDQEGPISTLYGARMTHWAVAGGYGNI